MTPDIEAQKGRIQMSLEANKGMVEYARTGIQWAFFLNGGAATAVLTKGTEQIYTLTAWFAFGALWAVICGGFAYWIQEDMFIYWRSNLFCIDDTDKPENQSTILKRRLAGFFFLASLVFFVIGVVLVHQKLTN